LEPLKLFVPLPAEGLVVAICCLFVCQCVCVCVCVGVFLRSC